MLCTEISDLGESNGGRFLKALLTLNNDYLGMGLSGIYLASGSDRVAGAAILKNKDLFHTLQGMNGEAQRAADAQNVVDQYHRPISNIDAAEQDFKNENARRQRAYVDKWRTAIANAVKIHVFGVANKGNLAGAIKATVEDIFKANGIRTNVIIESGKAEGIKPIGNDFYAVVQQSGVGDFAAGDGYSDVVIQAGIAGGIGINLAGSFISTDNISRDLKASGNSDILFEYAVAYSVAHEVAHQMASVGSFFSLGGYSSFTDKNMGNIQAGGLPNNYHSPGYGLNSDSQTFWQNFNKANQQSFEIIQWDMKKTYINPWLRSRYIKP